MLILTRKTGESIVIGDDIVITVVDAGRDQVRIGIDAPRAVSVHRQEVYQQISSENEAARAVDAAGLLQPAGPVAASALPTRRRP